MTTTIRSTHFRFFWASGTGNSRRAAVWAAEEAGTRGAVVTLMDMGERRETPWAADEFLGLFFPTHGFTAPWSVFRFVWSLPRGQGTPAFAVATRGGGWYLVAPLPGFAGTAAWMAGLLLLLKGYRLKGLTGLDMPSNWFSLHPAMSRKHAEFWKARSDARIRRFLARMLDGGRWFWTLDNLLELLLGAALLPVSLLYAVFGRFCLAKLFFANRRCNGCAACARHCPEQAILMKGHPERPYWTFKCESCMRCVAFCPERGVDASHGLALLYAWGVSLIPAGWLAQNLFGGSSRPWHLGIYYAGGLILAWGAYALFHRLIRLRPALAVAAATTLTTWYRRYRESGTLLKDFRRSKANDAVGQPGDSEP